MQSITSKISLETMIFQLKLVRVKAGTSGNKRWEKIYYIKYEQFYFINITWYEPKELWKKNFLKGSTTASPLQEIFFSQLLRIPIDINE